MGSVEYHRQPPPNEHQKPIPNPRNKNPPGKEELIRFLEGRVFSGNTLQHSRNPDKIRYKSQGWWVVQMGRAKRNRACRRNQRIKPELAKPRRETMSQALGSIEETSSFPDGGSLTELKML
ncbi:hypothetical protein NL676_015898 [Syzygium grande]|nr:hypothetical protein NL676_015898 [Syzygium grande]